MSAAFQRDRSCSKYLVIDSATSNRNLKPSCRTAKDLPGRSRVDPQAFDLICNRRPKMKTVLLAAVAAIALPTLASAGELVYNPSGTGDRME